MKKFLTLILTAIMLLTLSPNLGCQQNRVLLLDLLGTKIRVQSNDKNLSNSVKNQLTELFSSLENEFSPSKQGSTVNEFNNSNQNFAIAVSTRFEQVFKLSKDLYEYTDGAFNPCIMPLVELWQFSNFPSPTFTPPSISDITATLPLCDLNAIMLSNGQITKTKNGVKLDFGGILKGYAVDLALETLKANGYQTGYVSVGSSSLGLLNTETLSIQHPNATKQQPLILTLNTTADSYLTLSTSGDYERCYTFNDVKYSHIIDAKTGLTANTGVESATLIGVGGAVSDALTTAICTAEHLPNDFSNSKLVNLLNKITNTYPNAEFYVVYEKDDVKQVLTNKKQGERFTLLDTDYTVVNL